MKIEFKEFDQVSKKKEIEILICYLMILLQGWSLSNNKSGPLNKHFLKL